MRSKRGYEYNLIDALRRAKVTIMAGDCITDIAVDKILYLQGIIEAQRVDLSLLIGAVHAGDPNDELRVRVEDMERRLSMGIDHED